MADDLVQSVKARRVQISAALEAARTPPSLAAVKKDIIALFKQVDGAITDLTAVKAEIRTLVDRYKQAEEQGEAGGGTAPGIETARPVVQADHIGASTFIEKGWSLISLGDYDGAIQALAKALALSPGEVEAESLLGWAQMLKEDYDDALATLQAGRRPCVSESNCARVGARISVMGRSGNGPIPGNGGVRAAASARATARASSPGQATALTRPTTTACGPCNRSSRASCAAAPPPGGRARAFPDTACPTD